jgi:hypothetical protein
MFTRYYRRQGASTDGLQGELRRQERHRMPRSAAGYLRCTWQLSEQGDLVAAWHWVPPGGPGTLR